MEKKGNTYSNFILYSYWRASCAWRVRIALNLKGIEYTIKPINLLKGEQKQKEYLEVNKYGRLPCLEFTKEDETGKKEIIRLVESTAIIEFLETVFPDKYSLYSEDPILTAKIRAVSSHIACNIHPMQNLSTLQKVEEIGGDKKAWAFYHINRNLAVLEDELKETMGKFCFGDKVTLADVYIIPQLYFFKRFNEPLTDYPNIVKIQKNLEELDAFKLADPNSQIDCTDN